MNIKLKADSVNDIGPNFQLLADVGEVLPSMISSYQLLNGVEVTVNDSASSIIIRSAGVCNSSIIVSLTNANCT